MGSLTLKAITDQTPYVQKIKGALEKVTGQSIPRRKFNSIPKQLSEKLEHEKQLALYVPMISNKFGMVYPQRTGIFVRKSVQSCLNFIPRVICKN